MNPTPNQITECDDERQLCESVSESLDYDKSTGVFRWKVRPLSHFKDAQNARAWNNRNSGKISGNVSLKRGCKSPYMQIRLNGVRHYAHRLAWLICNGELPPRSLDHINGNGLDNRIENLRAASHHQNAANMDEVSNNTSGFRGVSWSNYYGKWVAKIKVDNKAIHLGYFDDKNEAIAARKVANKKYTYGRKEVKAAILCAIGD